MDKPILILGMGNKLFGDDGIGIIIAERLEKEIGSTEGIKFEYTSFGGFRIIDLLKDFKTAIIIDAFRTNTKPPGYIYEMTREQFSGSQRLVSFHSINFVTAIEFAKYLGIPMPEDIIIYGIEAKFTESFSEEISPEVENGATKCIGNIKKKLSKIIKSEKEVNEINNKSGGTMIAEDLTSLEALGIAIRSEIDAQEVYKDLADFCENDLLKNRFLNLYNEEKKHQALLEKMYKEMFPDVDLVLPPSMLPTEMNTSMARHKLTVKDVLKLAINEERISREFYLDCAENIKDLSGKRMFRFLADMEFSHQSRLTDELDMLEKYPSYLEEQRPWEVESRLKAKKIKR